MAVDLSKGNEHIIFAYAGNTMIGRIYTPQKKDSTNTLIENYPSQVTNDYSIIGNFIGGTGSEKGQNHYMIENPCIIEFSIKKPNTGSAKMEWNLKPFYYSVLLGDTSSGTHRIVFAFPKEQVALSSVGGTFIKADLVSAWKELCE